MMEVWEKCRPSRFCNNPLLTKSESLLWLKLWECNHISKTRMCRAFMYCLKIGNLWGLTQIYTVLLFNTKITLYLLLIVYFDPSRFMASNNSPKVVIKVPVPEHRYCYVSEWDPRKAQVRSFHPLQWFWPTFVFRVTQREVSWRV